MTEKDTRDMTDDELVRLAGRIRKVDEVPIEALLRLKNTIEKLDSTTSFYSKWLVGLTFLIAILTIVLLFKK